MVERLNNPLSRLLFLSCELFEEDHINAHERHLLKSKIFSNDVKFFQVVESIQDPAILKKELKELCKRLA